MSPPTIERVPGRWAVARLPAESPVPAWLDGERGFTSVTRSEAELSIVAPQERVPAGVRCERDFAMLRVTGPVPFDAIGVLRSLLAPLESARVPVLALSTFDTDYLLVRHADAERAVEALRGAGFPVA